MALAAMSICAAAPSGAESPAPQREIAGQPRLYRVELVEPDSAGASLMLPQGARLFNLSSHTHQRGKHFTVDLPDGSRIYVGGDFHSVLSEPRHYLAGFSEPTYTITASAGAR